MEIGAVTAVSNEELVVGQLLGVLHISVFAVGQILRMRCLMIPERETPFRWLPLVLQSLGRAPKAP